MKKRMLSAGLGLVFVVAVCGGVAGAAWMLHHGEARLLLEDQPATVSIPEPIPIKADITNALSILLDGKLTTTVPVDQMIQVPIKDTLHVMATLDHDVPIRMNVPIRDTVPVDQIVHVDSKVSVFVMGHALTLPIRGDVPIKTQVPLSIDVPVDQMVHLSFTAPADVKLTQALNVPLKADIHTTIPLHSSMDVPVRSALLANVTVPGPVEAIVTHADLHLPLRTLDVSDHETVDQHAAKPYTATPAPAAPPPSNQGNKSGDSGSDGQSDRHASNHVSSVIQTSASAMLGESQASGVQNARLLIAGRAP